MIHVLQRLAATWRRFYERKVAQAKAPQMPELEWMKERSGRIETELQTVRRVQRHESWRL
jgi:hypothetical protein